MQGNEEDTKGFTIRCGAPDDNGVGGDVVVTDDQAKQMACKCDYFLHVFAHGTRESLSRILVKPDWSVKTANQLVELLTTGKTEVCHESLLKLEEASQQILIDTSVCTPSFVVEGTVRKDTVLQESERLVFLDLFERRSNNSKICVEILGKDIDCDAWFNLLSKRILVSNDRSPSLSVRLSSSELASGACSLWRVFMGIGLPGGQSSKFTAEGEASKYSVGSLVHQVCETLQSPRSDVRTFTAEEYSLRVPFSMSLFGVDRQLAEKLSQASGAKVYFHRGNSLGYYLDGNNESCPTIAGTFEQIRDALNMINPDVIATYFHRLSSNNGEGCKRCSLRICAPSARTLDRLIKAAQECRDNPNTLGVDLGSNAFFAVKTVQDMKLMLNAITHSGSGGPGRTESKLTLTSLGYPKGVF